MTVKELADFTGKTERCIRNWVAKAAENNSAVAEKSSAAGHGKVVDYSIDEVEAILQNSSMSKDAVSLIMENARRTSAANESQYVTKSELKELMSAMGTEITSAVTKAMITAIPEIIKQTVTVVNREPLKIEQDYYSILGYCCKNNLHITSSEASRYGKLATRLSHAKGVEIKRVDDERYGSVGSYHISVLDEIITK